MGFDSRWIRLVMNFVKSVYYAIIVNDTPVGRIIPSRGIRQGDPLSPYLFILYAETLSSLQHHAATTGQLTSVLTSKQGPSINHIFFADDILFFARQNPFIGTNYQDF
jgi:hypothetical protein